MYVTQVAIEMHNVVHKQEAATERFKITNFLWTHLPSGKHCASRWPEFCLSVIVGVGEEEPSD
jgi:hypothetical protein